MKRNLKKKNKTREIQREEIIKITAKLTVMIKTRSQEKISITDREQIFAKDTADKWPIDI